MWPHWQWFATAIPALPVAIVNWALWVVKWILTTVPAILDLVPPNPELSKAKVCLCLHHLPISHLCSFCYAATWLEDLMALELRATTWEATASQHRPSCSHPCYLASLCSTCLADLGCVFLLLLLIRGARHGSWASHYTVTLHTTLWLYTQHCGSTHYTMALHTTLWLYILHCGSGTAQKKLKRNSAPKKPFTSCFRARLGLGFRVVLWLRGWFFCNIRAIAW